MTASTIEQSPEVFYIKGVLENFAIFTVFESLFNKVGDLFPATLLKRHSNTGVLLRNLQNFYSHLV